MITRSPNERLRFRPAFPVLFGLVSGIGLSTCINPPTFAIAAISVGVLIVLPASFFFTRWPIMWLLLCLVIACGLGYAIRSDQTQHQSESVLAKLSHRTDRACEIFGIVGHYSSHSTNADRLLVETDSVRIDSLVFKTRILLLLTVGRKTGSATIVLPQRDDRIHAYAELDDIDAKRNPYERPRYAAVMRDAGADATAYVTSTFDLYVTDSSHRAPTMLDRVRDSFDTVHTRIASRLSTLISDSVARAIILAVVLGDKVDIPAETTMAFRSAGLSHILVVSGFNVGIVAVLTYYLLRFIGVVRLRWRICFSMIVVAAYALIIGLEPSVLRALATVECVFIAILLERKPDIANITAATAAIALMFDPSLLTDAGFLLTYGAVLTIVLTSPHLVSILITEQLENDHSFVGRIKYHTAITFSSTLCVTLGLLPVMVWYFQRVTITGVLSNLIGIPLAGLLTSLSFILIPLSFISSGVAGAYADATTLLALSLNWLATVSGSLRWSSIIIPRPTITMIVVYLIALWYVVHSESRQRLRGRILVVASIIFCLICMNVPFASPLFARDENLSVLFCDVGQGDAILIHTPNGKMYAIDLGGVDRINGTAVAERTMIPLLNAEGISTISMALLTHMHIDHYGGAVSLSQHDRIASFGTSGERAASRSAFELDSLCRANHIPVLRLHRGVCLALDTGVKLYILNPDSARSVRSDEMNHHSLVMKLCYGARSILFLGDIEASDEIALARHYGDFLASDVVKVAHHGSRYSSDSTFASIVHPTYAIVSVGEFNRFGHPSRAALRSWHEAGAELHRTDLEGAQLFRSDGIRLWRDDWRTSSN